jgi:hypothetical protein
MRAALRLAMCLAIVLSLGPGGVLASVGGEDDPPPILTAAGDDVSSDDLPGANLQLDAAIQTDTQWGSSADVTDDMRSAPSTPTHLPIPAAAPPSLADQPIQFFTQPTARPVAAARPPLSAAPAKPTPAPARPTGRVAATPTNAPTANFSAGRRTSAASASPPGPALLASYPLPASTSDSSLGDVVLDPATHHLFLATDSTGVLELNPSTGELVAQTLPGIARLKAAVLLSTWPHIAPM